MPSPDPLTVLLPGQGAQPRDRYAVDDRGFPVRLVRVVVPAVRWAI